MRSLRAINKINSQKHSRFIILVWAACGCPKAMQISVCGCKTKRIQQWPVQACMQYLCSLGSLGASMMGEQNDVAHDLPTASYPPLPEAWSDNKISISTFRKSLWMGSLKRLKLSPLHHQLIDSWRWLAHLLVCCTVLLVIFKTGKSMRDPSLGMLGTETESKSLLWAIAAIRQMGRKWFLMVPGMSGVNCSQPLCRPSPWSICNWKRGGGRRGEEEEEASVRSAWEPLRGATQ